MSSSLEEPVFRLGLLSTLPDLARCLADIAELAPPLAALRLLHPAETLPPAPRWIPVSITGPDRAATEALVARNADLILAAADAGPTIELALARGIPVLVAEPGAPRLLVDRFWRVSTHPVPTGPAAWQALTTHIRATLASPDGPRPPALDAIEAASLPVSHPLWSTHRLALDLLAAPQPALAEPAPTLSPAQLGPWTRLFGPADALATAYADRYRSSYTLVLALAAIALLAAVIGLRSEHHWRFALPEALCLLGIIALVWLNGRADWRNRLIQCRLFAELCRKQVALTCLGRSLPVRDITPSTSEGGLAWIRWRFAASVRAAPVPTAIPTGPALEAARAAATAILLTGQRAYHHARASSNKRRERRLVLAGTLLFGATAAFVGLKLALLLAHREEAELAGLLAAALPAGAAALFGFRAYAELELMVQQSERLIAVIAAAEAGLTTIDASKPGAASAIGDILEETALQMLEDVTGWMQLAQVKAVETS